MIYPHNFEQKIGFDKIRQHIENKCLSTLGIDRAKKMVFISDYDTIARKLHETEEFDHILQEEDEFPANYFFDVRPALKRIRVEGTFLDESELFDLRRSLETIKGIVYFFLNKETEENTPYPYLQKLAGDVTVFPQIIIKTDQIRIGHLSCLY